MRIYAMIAVGGFWGAILRFFIKTIGISSWNTYFPLNTLIINVTGSLILGFFIITAEDVLKLREAEKLGMISGFLGAFTTFSAISKEISQQLATGHFIAAGLYMILSVLLGLGAVWLGVMLGRRLKLHKQRAGKMEEI